MHVQIGISTQAVVQAPTVNSCQTSRQRHLAAALERHPWARAASFWHGARLWHLIATFSALSLNHSRHCRRQPCSATNGTVTRRLTGSRLHRQIAASPLHRRALGLQHPPRWCAGRAWRRWRRWRCFCCCQLSDRCPARPGRPTPPACHRMRPPADPCHCRRSLSRIGHFRRRRLAACQVRGVAPDWRSGPAARRERARDSTCTYVCSPPLARLRVTALCVLAVNTQQGSYLGCFDITKLAGLAWDTQKKVEPITGCRKVSAVMCSRCHAPPQPGSCWWHGRVLRCVHRLWPQAPQHHDAATRMHTVTHTHTFCCRRSIARTAGSPSSSSRRGAPASAAWRSLPRRRAWPAACATPAATPTRSPFSTVRPPAAALQLASCAASADHR